MTPSPPRGPATIPLALGEQRQTRRGRQAQWGESYLPSTFRGAVCNAFLSSTAELIPLEWSLTMGGLKNMDSRV